MIHRLWAICGRIAFWLSWPLLFVYLKDSQRTRVLVVCDEDILVVRGWLGNGRWSLPGGGLHQGEKPENGAIRELQEEVGIEVAASDLQKLFYKEYKSKYSPTLKIHSYILVLDKKPDLVLQKSEIYESRWVPKQELRSGSAIEDDLRDSIDAIY